MSVLGNRKVVYPDVMMHVSPWWRVQNAHYPSIPPQAHFVALKQHRTTSYTAPDDHNSLSPESKNMLFWGHLLKCVSVMHNADVRCPAVCQQRALAMIRTAVPSIAQCNMGEKMENNTKKDYNLWQYLPLKVELNSEFPEMHWSMNHSGNLLHPIYTVCTQWIL